MFYIYLTIFAWLYMGFSGVIFMIVQLVDILFKHE